MDRRREREFATVTTCCFVLALLANALLQSTPLRGDSPKTRAELLERNVAMKTLGGWQFWGDVAVFHDWKIQKHAVTGHYRLLDGENYRHASGTFEECREKLEEIKTALKLPPMKGKAVILIHGIVRTSRSFEGLGARLKQEGYEVFWFEYPSTRTTIPQAAEDLHRVIESMEGIEEIHFVVHSMGGLVVRSYLKEHRDPRIRRMVMMGVPNRGAVLANRLQKNVLYRLIFGPAGQQLVKDPDGFIAALPTPDFEFAVIAGARGTLRGFNPLVPGDDDGTVSVASTRLPGAADFMTVRCLHAILMNHKPAIEATVRFLKTSKLRETGDRQPIPQPEPPQAKKRQSDKGTVGQSDEGHR